MIPVYWLISGFLQKLIPWGVVYLGSIGVVSVWGLFSLLGLYNNERVIQFLILYIYKCMFLLLFFSSFFPLAMESGASMDADYCLNCYLE